jgi:hypothetical protein
MFGGIIMHWLLILGLLGATANVSDRNASNQQLNRLAENAIRRELGNSVRSVRVDLQRGNNRGGDFDYFNVTLDGFDANRFAQNSARDGSSRNSKSAPDWLRAGEKMDANSFDIADIFSGKYGDIFNGDFGDIVGGILTGGVGRVGKMQINAGNFSYDGVRYQNLSAGLGEIRFDWKNALRGDIEIESMQSGNLGLQLRADQATKLLAPRLPSVRNAQLRFQNGAANLSGQSDWYGVRIPFEVGGKLSVQTNQVRAEDLNLKIARLRLPDFVADEITRSVNPLYDFDPDRKWPIAVNLSTADARNDVLSMRGGLRWLNGRRKDNEGKDDGGRRK